MLVYLLKSSLILAILLTFYKLFLERESIHVFKRYFLLFSLLFALTIPLITFTQYIEEPLQILNSTTDTYLAISPISQLNIDPEINYLPKVLWSLYGLGAFIFGLRFINNLRLIWLKIKRNQKIKRGNFIYILLHDLVIPHTFFNYLFFSKTKFKTHQIPKEVLLHEEAHAIQKHSVDVLIVEVLGVLLWFNPLVSFLKKSIKLNHEFLADSIVIKDKSNISSYQKILLEYSTNPKGNILANAINYSLIKKRFDIMKKQTSRKTIWLRIFILLPILSLLLYSFSDKKIAVKNDSYSNNQESHNKVRKFKATPEQVKEYNNLAKKYNSQSNNNSIVIKIKEMNRIRKLYSLMTNEQKQNAETYPVFPPQPSINYDNPIRVSKKFYSYTNNEGKEIKVELQYDMTLPPPPPAIGASKEEKKNYQISLNNYKEWDKVKNTISYSVKNENYITPPPPPKSQLDHVIEMAKKNAIFYLENKIITSDRAIEIIKNSDDMNILTQKIDSKEPQVYISREPIP